MSYPQYALVMRRGVRWGTAIALGLVVLSPVALALYSAEIFLRPAWYKEYRTESTLRSQTLRDPHSAFGIRYEDVEFPAIDGSTLRGWFVPSTSLTTTAVIGVHGGGSNRSGFLGLLPELHERGYPVLLFDCRDQGVSDGPDRGMGLGMRESADVVSALDFLEARGFERFAALGSSQGATSSILAAAIDSRIAAVVAQGTGTTLYEMMRSNAALAAFPDWWVRLFEQTVLWRTGPPWHEVVDNGPNPGDVIDRIAPRAVFLIHGEHDEMAPLAQARENFARAGEPKQLWVVPGARHRGLREAAGTEYAPRVLAFLERHVPPR